MEQKKNRTLTQIRSFDFFAKPFNYIIFITQFLCVQCLFLVECHQFLTILLISRWVGDELS